jgi:hypothetical protein
VRHVSQRVVLRISLGKGPYIYRPGVEGKEGPSFLDLEWKYAPSLSQSDLTRGLHIWPL